MIQIITTGESNARSSTRGSDGGAAIRSNRINTAASNRPIALPATGISALSVNSCRASRARVPPRAARIASSRWRATPRERSRLATLAHAISRTSAAAAATIESAGRAFTVMSSPSGRACTTGGPPFPKKNPLEVVRRRRACRSRPFCLGLCQGNAQLQPPQRREHERPRLRRRRLRDRMGHPETHPGFGKPEGGRHDADDGMRDAIDVQRRADRVGGQGIPIVRARATRSRSPPARRVGRSSSEVKRRPYLGGAPSVPSTADETRAPGTFTRSRPSVTWLSTSP